MKYLKLFEKFTTDKLAYIRHQGMLNSGSYVAYIWDEDNNKSIFFDMDDNYKSIEGICKYKGYKVVSMEDFYSHYNEIKSKLLLAPNGKISNLPPDLWKLVRTEEFKKWFGDFENDPINSSKAVDKNGEPVIVYHGTTADFHEFDRKLLGSRGGLKEKYFTFTTNKNMAEYYSKGTFGRDEGYIKPYFLNIREMPDYNNHGKYYREFKTWCGYDWKGVFYLIDFHEDGFSAHDDKNPGTTVDFQKTDGFVIRNTIEKETGWGDKDPNDYKLIGDTYYVYNSNQIKIADGTNIRFSSSNKSNENIKK
jgi:hypothetical protein